MPYMTIDFTYAQKEKKEKIDRITQKTWDFFIVMQSGNEDLRIAKVNRI